MIPSYLEDKQLPRHLQIALDFMGVAEIVGKGSNPLILSWAKELGLSDVYEDDDTAWCGLFFAICAKRAGRELPVFKDKYDYLRALKYAGIWLPVMRGGEGLGDVLIFQRPQGGHIGFYVGESKNTYYVIGGNQGNKVSISEIAKDRCVAIRRPKYDTFKAVAVHLDSSGKLSTNEA
jgi:uncharacterized protein (TIGR02594 family)